MPRVPKDQRAQGSQQQSLASRIRAGKVVPLISNTISNDTVLGGHTALVKKYGAEKIGSQLKHTDNLAHMLQFKYITDDSVADSWGLGLHYIDFIKNHLFDLAEEEGISKAILAEVEEEFDEIEFFEFARRLGYPQFDKGLENPLLLLASLPFPIYLTTSYHGFLEAALQKAGKSPHTEICPWHRNLKRNSIFDDGKYEPDSKQPVVYHLHGYDRYPDSLVLTEDHYLEFLMTISENRGTDNDRIPGRIRRALAESALILLGYSLDSWDFRTLFWGLIMPRPRPPKSVSVQLRRESEDEHYLERYLAKAEFDVIWTDTVAYLKSLHQEVEGQL